MQKRGVYILVQGVVIGSVFEALLLLIDRHPQIHHDDAG